MHDGALSKRHLKTLVQARANTASSFPFNTVAELEQYCVASIASVYFLLLESLASEEPELRKTLVQTDHVASHVGQCLGLVNVLRGTPHNARRGRCYMPSDLLAKHGASHQQFLRLEAAQPVCDVCFDLSCVAKSHLDVSLRLLAQLRQESARSLFLPILFAQMYLQRIEKAHFNVFSHELQNRDTNLPLKFWYKCWRLKWSVARAESVSESEGR